MIPSKQSISQFGNGIEDYLTSNPDISTRYLCNGYIFFSLTVMARTVADRYWFGNFLKSVSILLISHNIIAIALILVIPIDSNL